MLQTVVWYHPAAARILRGMPEVTWLRLVALVAFVGTYLGLALGRLPGFRVDRTGVAIIGATVMVVAGVLPWDKAVAAVDAHTLVLLFGMMIVAAYLRLSGFFHLVTHWVVRRARGPVGLLATVVLAAGVLSAFFVNDAMCLVLAPVVLEVYAPPGPQTDSVPAGRRHVLQHRFGCHDHGQSTEHDDREFFAHLLSRVRRALAPVALPSGSRAIVVIASCIGRHSGCAPPVNLVANFPIHAALMTKTIVAVCVMLVAFFAGCRSRWSRSAGRLCPPHEAGQAREGLPRDRLAPPGPVHRPVRHHRRSRGGAADRLSLRAGRPVRPVPAGRAHGRHGHPLEPRLERARGAPVQDRGPGVSGSPRARGSSWRWRPPLRATSRSSARSPT